MTTPGPSSDPERLRLLFEVQNSSLLASSLVAEGCGGVRAATQEELLVVDQMWGRDYPHHGRVDSRFASHDLAEVLAWLRTATVGSDVLALRRRIEGAFGGGDALVVVDAASLDQPVARSLEDEGQALVSSLGGDRPRWVLIDAEESDEHGILYSCESWALSGAPETDGPVRCEIGERRELDRPLTVSAAERGSSAGLRPEVRVLNAYLAVAAGSHRVPGWSFGRAREGAMRGVWDELVLDEAGRGRYRAVTDSNINNACVYELASEPAASGPTVYVSTLLPAMTVFDWRHRRALDVGALALPEQSLVARLGELGIRYVDDVLCRTRSPYRDDVDDHALTYFEVLFEWVDASSPFEDHGTVAPWS
ncbi:hypothetical protein [Cellulomonas soli]